MNKKTQLNNTSKHKLKTVWIYRISIIICIICLTYLGLYDYQKLSTPSGEEELIRINRITRKIELYNDIYDIWETEADQHQRNEINSNIIVLTNKIENYNFLSNNIGQFDLNKLDENEQKQFSEGNYSPKEYLDITIDKLDQELALLRKELDSYLDNRK